jgi:N-acetyl-gamma-glutamyl-phosphate reductase
MTEARVGIVGASGYAGGELARLIAFAPGVRLTLLASETYAGRPLADSFPGFRFPAPDFEAYDPRAAADRCDLVFLAQANGSAMRSARDLLASGLKVIDLSADFRLADPSLYPAWYRMEHADPDLLAEAVYGLPETNAAAIATARLVANPGCYPTAAVLALLPAVERGWIDLESVVIDAKSGVSGAGRSHFALDYHFSEVNESMRAYGVAGRHRHTPEIEQSLSRAAERAVRVTFTPHLVPVTRGILATAYARLLAPIGEEEVRAAYVERYEKCPFVHVLNEQPTTKGVNGSNQCHLAIAVDARTGRLVATAAIDNLVKGAAGQAVQNMNLMMGLPETSGLERPGLWP